MKPIHTANILGAPADWGACKYGPCIGLPVLVTDDPFIVSWWRPSWRERLAILLGRPVRVCLVGRTHAPIAITAGGTP
jgi:hypothetical protein